MDTVVNQWYAAEMAGYSEIVANILWFLRVKKLLFRFSFVLPAFGKRLHFEKLFDGKTFFDSFRYWCDIHSKPVIDHSVGKVSGHIF